MGTWELSSEGTPYITKLTVTRADDTVTVAIAGHAFIISTGGGLASGTCVAGGECTWGNSSLTYSGDPLQFSIDGQAGVAQRLTLAPIDGSTLSAVYRVQGLPDMTSSFTRSRFNPVFDLEG